jgi:hypothetical protein
MNNLFFDEPKADPGTISGPDKSVTTNDEAFQRVTNPRVQFLKLTTFVRTNRGIPGKTYPFCPSGPTLARPSYPDTEDEVPKRRASPLQNIAFSAFSRKITSR